MHLACMFECLHAFQTKINRIYQREFSGVSMETSAILYSRTSTSNNLNKSRKRINQFIQVFSYELCKKIFKGKYIFLSFLSKKSNNVQHVLISIVGTSHHGSFRLLYIKKVEFPII